MSDPERTEGWGNVVNAGAMNDRFQEGQRAGMERAAERAQHFFAHSCDPADIPACECGKMIADAIRAEAASLPEHKCIDPETVLNIVEGQLAMNLDLRHFDANCKGGACPSCRSLAAIRAAFKASGVEL
jgi:hypothetical protein